MSNPRIAYVSPISIRSKRAHIHNSLKTCEALQGAGAEVTFLHPGPRPNDLSEIFAAHRIKIFFRTEFLDSIGADDLINPKRIKRGISFLKMYWSLARFLIKASGEYDVVYYRHHILLPVALIWRLFISKPVYFECHYVFLKKYIAQAVTSLAVHTANGVVSITDALNRHYNLSRAACVMVPCHAAEHELVPKSSMIELRSELGLPGQSKILCYTGTVGSTIQGISYEVETMVNLLADLPENYVSLVVGVKDSAESLVTLATRLGVEKRLILVPWTEREKVFKYLAASDVLVMPRVGTAPGSSPSKMFDYLAVGKPIVAASTPPVEEILTHGHNALLVNADKRNEWAEAVIRLERETGLADRLGAKAKSDGFSYTWERRGRRIKWFLMGNSLGHREKYLKKLARNLAQAVQGFIGRMFIAFFGTKSGLILAYHSVSESPWIHAVSPELFREQLSWLKGHAEIVPLAQLQKEVFGSKSAKRKKPLVAITFDDGYKDWVETVLPILSDLGLPASFFVTTSFKLVTTVPQEGLEPMSDSQVRLLSKAEHEIGSHGHTHADLSVGSTSEFEREIKESRLILEGLAERSVERISFPKGRADGQKAELLIQNGYVMALAGHGGVSSQSNPLLSPRLPVYKNTGLKQLTRLFYWNLFWK